MKKLTVFLAGLLLSTTSLAAIIGETVKGTTDYSVEIVIIDETDGTRETAVEHNTTGIDLWCRRDGAAVTSLTEAALAALTTAHADGGIEHISHGVYRLDLPDSCVATGVDFVSVGGTVTGMIVIGGRVQLTDVDMMDGVRGGMTALPNAAADAAGGLVISDAGGLDIDGLNTNVNDIETDTADMQPKLGTFTDFGSGTSTLSANLQDLADNGTATYDRSTDSLQAIRDRGDTSWVTGGAGSGTPTLADNTAQSGSTSTTLVMAAAESFADDVLNDRTYVCINAGTGAGQCRNVEDNVGSTDTLTVDAAWTVTPDNTSDYFLQSGTVNVALFGGDPVTTTLLSARDVGLTLSTTVSTVNSTTNFDLAAGATNDDAYNEFVACFLGGTEEACIDITDYVAASNEITISAAPPFTVATSDEVRIYPPNFATVSGTVDANIVQVDGDATAAQNAESFFDGTGYAGTGNTIPTVSVLTGHTAQTGDSYARLGAPVGASISADLQVVDGNVDDVETDTADMQPKLGTFTDFGSGTSTLAANLQDLADDGTATYDRSTDSQQAIRDRGDAAWTTGSGTGLTAIATGTAQSATATTLVLASGETFADDELIGSVLQITGGSAGVGQTKCITDNVGSTDTVTVSTWTTTPTGTITYEIAPSLGTTCPDSAATIATTVVDEWETQSQADPTGFHVNVLEIGGTAQTANDNGADINAILVDTAEIGAAGAGLTEAGGTGDQFTAVPYNSSWDAEIQSEATDALNAYDPPTRAELTTDINSLLAIWGIAEPGSVPNFSSDAGDIISWLLALSRNEINQTSTTKTIRNDADTGNIATCSVSDDGTTFTRAECN